MEKLVLNEAESLELQRDGAVEIIRNGFYILVEKEKDYNGGGYIITVVNPYDEVVINLDMKNKAKEILKRRVGK